MARSPQCVRAILQLCSQKHFSRILSNSVWKNHNPYKVNNCARRLCIPVADLSTKISEQILNNDKHNGGNIEDLTASEIIEQLNPELARKLKILKLEHSVWSSKGHKVPEDMKDHMWLDLLNNYPTVSSRRKIYNFWFKTEKKIESGRRKQEARRKERESRPVIDLSEPCTNRILQHYGRARLHQMLHYNLAFAMVHGPHLIIDMGFEQWMSKREITNVMRQLQLAHGFNQIQNEPFHLHFVNLGSGSELATSYEKYFKDLLYTSTEKNYLDMYAKEDLVYLSPNAPKMLDKYDPNVTYIIGGIVDAAVEEPLTFAKSKREGIRCAKLPLDLYLKWQQGGKSLTLDQMVKILYTLKETESDWKEALQHVPSRKFTWK